MAVKDDSTPGEPPAPTGAELPEIGAPDEFAGLEPYRPRRSPLLAAAVILISGYLLFHLRHDLTYALRGRTPAQVTDVRGYFRDPARIPDNSFVAMRAVPDRAHAVMLDIKGKDEFMPFMRVMGTDGRLLLAQRRGLRPLGEIYDDVYAGRLMRLADVSYAPTVRDYYAKKVTATRFFHLDEVRAALGARAAGRPVTLRDAGGDAVPMSDAGRLMGVDVSYRGDYELGLPRERFPAEADARAALDRLGVEVKEAAESGTELRFVVHIDDARRDKVIAELGALDPRIEVKLRKRSFTVPWGGLQALPEGLLVPATATSAATTLPWDAITAVTTVEPLTIPPDAFVLVEGERPQDLWYVPVFALCFVIFVVWNLLALRSALRRPAKS
jgi:hypothetical protein